MKNSSHSNPQSPAVGPKHSGLLDTGGKLEVLGVLFSCASVDRNGFILLTEELLQKLLHTQISFTPALYWLSATGVNVCRVLQGLSGYRAHALAQRVALRGSILQLPLHHRTSARKTHSGF